MVHAKAVFPQDRILKIRGDFQKPSLRLIEKHFLLLWRKNPRLLKKEGKY